MKRQNEFAEGTSEDRARDQLADRIIGLSAAYRTREWQKIPIARVLSHPLKKSLPFMDRHRVERVIRPSVGHHRTHDLNAIENPIDPGYVLDDSFNLQFKNRLGPFPCQGFAKEDRKSSHGWIRVILSLSSVRLAVRTMGISPFSFPMARQKSWGG